MQTTKTAPLEKTTHELRRRTERFGHTVRFGIVGSIATVSHYTRWYDEPYCYEEPTIQIMDVAEARRQWVTYWRYGYRRPSLG